MYNHLKDIVENLINRGFEGDYWDFKQKWHEKNEKLLHDILCFANTVHVKDCFLIFGVSDNCEIIGVLGDTNRKKQADLLDMINNCRFAADNKPKINLETIIINNKELDILIIFNTNNTPLYITKKCKKYNDIQENIIYSREGDRNTPIKENSNIYEIERLWKKRFGLNRNCIQEFKEILKDKKSWGRNKNGYYYVYNPEFRIEERSYDEDYLHEPFYAYVMTNESSFYYEIQLIYKGTILNTFQEVVLDGGRYTTISPNSDYIYKDKWGRESYEFRSYTKGTLEYLLYNFLFDDDFQEAGIAKYKFDKIVMIFDDEKEKKEFIKFIEENKQSFIEEIEETLKKEYKKYDFHNESYNKYLNEVITSCKLTKKYLNKLREKK